MLKKAKIFVSECNKIGFLLGILLVCLMSNGDKKDHYILDQFFLKFQILLVASFVNGIIMGKFQIVYKKPLTQDTKMVKCGEIQEDKQVPTFLYNLRINFFWCGTLKNNKKWI